MRGGATLLCIEVFVSACPGPSLCLCSPPSVLPVSAYSMSIGSLVAVLSSVRSDEAGHPRVGKPQWPGPLATLADLHSGYWSISGTSPGSWSRYHRLLQRARQATRGYSLPLTWAPCL